MRKNPDIQQKRSYFASVFAPSTAHRSRLTVAGEIIGRMPIARTFIIDSQTPAPLSAILMKPRRASACFVLAHGAGADMSHTFMEEIATSLYDRHIATLRYQFPFMENGRRRRPDRPTIAHDAVRIAVTEAKRRCRGLPLFAGGKSFGGRMTSQAQALSPLVDVRGLILLGFPLHTPAKPSDTRADHLYDVRVPMLFIQGTRDKLAQLPLLMPVVEELRGRATLHIVRDADHSFQLPARSRRTGRNAASEVADAIADWTLARSTS